MSLVISKLTVVLYFVAQIVLWILVTRVFVKALEKTQLVLARRKNASLAQEAQAS